MEADMSETVIEFKDVDMSFGDKTVLDHVSFPLKRRDRCYYRSERYGQKYDPETSYWAS